MAVNIPVVIDIDKAFDEASKRVNSAIRPLQRSIEDGTANIKLKIGEQYDAQLDQVVGKYETLGHLINDVQKNQKTGAVSMKYSIEEWASALDNAKQRLADLNALQANGQKVDPNRLNALRESVSVLTALIDQRRNEADLIERSTQKQISATRAIEAGNYALIQEANTISQISDKLSALRGKLENLDPSKNRKEWTATAKEIEKATAQLQQYKQKLADTTKPGSIDRMRAEMQKLEQQWNSMSKRQKFDADGNLTASAQRVVKQFQALTAESEKYGQSLSRMAGRVKPAIDATTNSLRTQSSVLRSISAYASMYVSVFGAIRFVKQIRDVTAELEYQRVALGRLLQDVDKGNALFERIKEAAIESPFRIKDLVTYTKQLAAYRIEQEALFDTTKRLADISAGLGVDMNRLILAYGQVRAASVLRGQELRQFTEAGIPLVELLAEKFTDLRGEMVSTADVFKLISERAVPFSMISDIFEDLTEKGGMFYKMQEEQAKTLKGRWEKLKDAYDIALQGVGETETFQKFNDFVIESLGFLAKNLRTIVKLVDGAVISWGAYNAIMLLSGKRTALVATEQQAAAIATEVRSRSISGVVVKIMGQAAAEKALTAATTQATIGTNALSRALGRLKVVLLTNPWAAAAAAVVGLILALRDFRKAANDASEASNTLNRAIDDMHSENTRHARIENLIKQYKELSEVTEKNVGQGESLSRTMKKLSAEFPEYAEKIKDNNLPLAERLQLIRDLNSEEAKRLNAIKEEKEATLKASETKLSYAESEADIKHQAKVDATNYYNTLQSTLDSLQKEGKGPRGFWGHLFQGSNEYENTYRALVEARKMLDSTEKDYNDASASVESLKDGIKDLRKELYGAEEETNEISAGWKVILQRMQLSSSGAQLFSNEQLEGWHRLYDVSTDLEKEWKKLKEDIEGLKSAMPNENDPLFPDWNEDLKMAQSNLEGLELIMRTFGFIWGKQNKTSGYQKSAFITEMENRIKFMQDFKKGYDDLTKYLRKSSALSEVSVKMMGRGSSLGLSAADQARAAEDLSGWYEDMIKEVSSRLRNKGVSGLTTTDLLGVDTTRRSKDVQDLQKLLQSLWDAKTDFDISEKKKEFEDALKRLSDEVKRSEAARNFYNDILDLTGDEELAATLGVSVYGGIGDEFKERMQQQLNHALESLKAEGPVSKELEDAFSSMNFKEILATKDLPEEVEKVVRQAYESVQKYNNEVSKNYSKLLLKFDEIEQQRVNVTRLAAKDIATIEEGLALEISGIRERVSDKNEQERLINEARERARAASDAVRRQEALDLSRLERDYRLFFSSVGVISEQAARKISNAQKKMLTEQFERGEISLSKYKREVSEVDKQMQKYIDNTGMFASYLTNGVDGIISELNEYAEALLAIGETPSIEFDDDTKKYIDRLGAIFGGKIFGIDGVSGRKNVADKLEAAITAASKTPEEYARKMSEALANAANELQSRSAGFSRGVAIADLWVKNIGNLIIELDQLGNQGKETSKWWNDVANVLMKIPTLGLSKSDDAGDRFATMNQYAMEGFEKFKSGNFVGALFDVYRSWESMFGPNVKAIDREIEKQADIISDLEHSYSRLEVAIDEAFGSDYVYNYNKEIDVLQAQAEAYRKQAELERSKGKKADEDVAKGYEASARDIEDKIKDMQGQLAEFFTGTNLTSAAQDFAKAWIDAYKEFGSTTDAMKEKFNEMVENMVVNSLAAKLIQDILRPVFDQIDAASKDGELTAQEIGSISSLVPERVKMINDAMAGMVNQLGVAGINLRNTVGQFSGISRNIAGASEESINGLAAGINTQNFYMQHIDLTVSAILSVLSGGTAGTTDASGAEVVDPYKNQMLMYVASLPQMRDDMASVRAMLEKVIRPVGTTTTHYVAVKL